MQFLKKLFGSSGPKNVTIEIDSVWQTDQAKRQGIGKEIQRADQSDAVAILVIAHFADSLRWVQEVTESISCQTPVMAVLADQLSASIASGLDVTHSDIIELIIAERHPLPRVDGKVLNDFAAVLPCRCRVTYHHSLEEPLMRQFAGDNLSRMLEMLGMQPDEKIESSMVTRAIRNAQKRLASALSSNSHSGLKADSMEEWFQKNVSKK
ncbi:hypothetical protein LOC67_13110 [Stieleria sp. JC731]|uniref:hypothetical protein n=1 Tax=Pirellulaceae TaxID=2691357 RepID=UPI001E31AC33|nr:hypothetical protein [Stieleria sp. JC731]MCC9601489.1 hypothetical protein [Stieleria sp. JC731]